MMPIRDVMTLAPVIPVLVIDDAATARPVGEALVAGGLRALEVTLRTPAALEVIAEMARVPGAVVGAGTVTEPAQVDAALKAGATFLVSPGITDRLAQAAIASHAAFLPGVATASELIRALEYGLDSLKFFPAEANGGVPALKALGGPFADVRFCPTGGITPESAPAYLGLPNVLCVGGSWLCPPALVKDGNWAAITELARKAAAFGTVA